MDAITVDRLSHLYSTSRKSETIRHALKDVSFTVKEAELFGLVGPNGGGKTTLFHILATVLSPTSGKAAVFGHPVSGAPDKVRRHLGVVFQSPSLDKKLTVEENLRHQGHLYGLRGAPLKMRIDETLMRFALADRRADRVEILSGGLKRRVELAKGLLHRPRVLLLDEPSTGLDPGARRDLWDYLKELKSSEGITVIVTTHLMEEADGCDRVAILHEGRLVTSGTPAELKGQIGGDVISVESAEPERLREAIAAKFGGSASVVDGIVRLERVRGHEFIPQLVAAFPGQVNAVRLGKPTLEDVFIHHTGHRFSKGMNGS